MSYLKSRTQYIKENYLNNAKDFAGKVIGGASKGITNVAHSTLPETESGMAKSALKGIAKMGSFPKGDMDKFIEVIKMNNAGQVVTIESIEDTVRQYVRVSAVADRTNAMSTDNINIVKAISELIYDEMLNRNEIDLTHLSSEDEDEYESEYDEDEYDEEK
jgi:hypothetical protein